MSLHDMEKLFITETLHRRNGNRKRASRDLGISASTLYRKIKAYDIDAPDADGRGRRR